MKLAGMQLMTQAARCFLAIAEAGSIRKAADRLNLSASSVNRHLKQLEWHLNTSLFDRVPTGMRLTDAGKLLVAELQTAEQRFARLANDIDSLTGLKQGHISIGVVECFGREFLPEILTELRRDFPGLSVDVHIERNSVLTEKLLAGTIDLALGFDLPDFPEFQTIADYHIPVGLVFSPNHTLATADRLPPLSDCLKQDLLLPEKSFGLFQTLEHVAATAGIRLHPAIVANSIESLKTLARNGTGITFLTALDVYDEVTRNLLCFHPIESNSQLTEHLRLCVNAHRDHSHVEEILAPRIGRDLRRVEQRLFDFLQQPVQM